jgi:hypothetical protein
MGSNHRPADYERSAGRNRWMLADSAGQNAEQIRLSASGGSVDVQRLGCQGLWP